MSTGRRPRYDRSALLAVAVGVFNQRGYDGTSMDHLATAAGLSKSSLYHHFASKETVLRVATDRALDALFAVLDEEGATAGAAIDRFEHVLRRTAEILAEELPYVTLLLRVRGNTRTETRALKRRRQFDERVSALLEQARVEGDLRADLDPTLATRLLFGMVNSISEWYRPNGPLSPQQVAAAVVDLVSGGLRAAGWGLRVPGETSP